MYSSPLFCYLDPLKPKMSSWTPIVEQPQSVFPSQCEKPRLSPMQNNRKSYVCVYLNIFLGSNMEDKKDSSSKDRKHSLTSVCSYFLHKWNFNFNGCSQIPELFRPFKGFIFNPETLCFLLVSRRNIYIGFFFFGIYIWTILLTSDY